MRVRPDELLVFRLNPPGRNAIGCPDQDKAAGTAATSAEIEMIRERDEEGSVASKAAQDGGQEEHGEEASGTPLAERRSLWAKVCYAALDRFPSSETPRAVTLRGWFRLAMCKMQATSSRAGKIRRVSLGGLR